MVKSNVVVIGNLEDSLLNKLKEKAELKIWDKVEPIPKELLYQYLNDAHGFICRGDIPIDEDLLSQAPKLKVIAQASVGYDNVDISACTDHLIPFCNTPGVLVEATADLAFGLILSSARQIPQGWEYIKEGNWISPYKVPLGTDLYGKTLGIIGMGNIGRGVAKRAQASGMNVIYHNRKRNDENDGLGAGYSELDSLLKGSDFILVLVPLSKHTHHLIGESEFSKMKESCHFINVSRGAVVNTDDLYNALSQGDIAHAALDVTDPEPIHLDHPLMKLDNVFITPHIGSATVETRFKMAELTVDNLLAGLNGEKLITCVNEELNSVK